MSRYIYNITEINKVAVKHNIPKDLEKDLEDLIDNAEMSLSNIWVSDLMTEINFQYEDKKEFNLKDFKEIEEKISKQMNKILKNLNNSFDLILTTKFKSIQKSYFNSKVKLLKKDLEKSFKEINNKFDLIKNKERKNFSDILKELKDFYHLINSYQEEGALFENNLKSEIMYVQDVFSSFENSYIDKDYVAESIVSELEDFLTFTRLGTLFYIAYVFDLTLTRD